MSGLTNGLSFFIEARAGIDVLEWPDNGCRPATDAEKELWQAYHATMEREERLRRLIQNIHQHYNPGFPEFDIKAGLEHLPYEVRVSDVE